MRSQSDRMGSAPQPHRRRNLSCLMYKLASEVRHIIYHLKLCWPSPRGIGRRLGRAHTAISPEIKRNGRRSKVGSIGIRAHTSQRCNAEGSHGRYRSDTHIPLVRYVEQDLRAEWTPDVIAAKMKLKYSDDTKMRVSIEMVYRWVYRDARQGGQLFSCLCRCHKSVEGSPVTGQAVI